MEALKVKYNPQTAFGNQELIKNLDEIAKQEAQKRAIAECKECDERGRKEVDCPHCDGEGRMIAICDHVGGYFD